jgi:LysR family nitrogen assimilation transcriptional regulator
MVELETLKIFTHVAATGSFSRAAGLIASTQSAVSKRMATLEKQLATRLFERTGRGVQLTEAGRLLLPRAEALASEADGLADLLAADRRAPRGMVRVAVQPSVAWPLMGKVVAEATERYPGIRLQIAEGTTRQIEEWLGEGRIDLGVMSSAPAAVRAESRRLFELPMLLAGKAGNPETSRREISFIRLARLPLVIATIPNGGRVLIEEEARRRRLALNIVLEVNSIHLVKRLVASRGLYTIASYPSVAAEIDAGELTATRIVRPEIGQTFFLATAGRRRPGAAVCAVGELIARHSPAPTAKTGASPAHDSR